MMMTMIKVGGDVHKVIDNDDDDYICSINYISSFSYWLVTRNYTPVGDIYTHTNPPDRSGLVSIANDDESDVGK